MVVTKDNTLYRKRKFFVNMNYQLNHMTSDQSGHFIQSPLPEEVDSERFQLLGLISLGSLLEYYDFGIFIYLAPLLGKTLIPASNEFVNLLLSYSIFAIGALFRPLGGMIFAHLGDTRGRKYTFVYTILLMAVPTLGIALIPNAHLIGVWATVLLILLRIFQVLAIEGEIPGSVVFGYELSSLKRKAFNSSIVIMGTNIGFFLASLVCTLLVGLHFNSFESWRLAFVLGGLFGIVSFFLRRSLIETPAFTEYKRLLQKETVPAKLLFAHYKKPLFQLLGIGCFLSSSLALFTFYMPNYLAGFYHFPLQRLMEFNSFTVVIFVLGSLLAGLFDQYFTKKFFICFALSLSLVALVLFRHYGDLTINQILFVHSWILLGVGIICGRFPVLCATFFPVSVRYTGVAFVYNISFGVVAGCTQMLLTGLIKATGLLWVPALYLSFFAIFSVISLISIKARQLVEYQK